MKSYLHILSTQIFSGVLFTSIFVGCFLVLTACIVQAQDADLDTDGDGHYDAADNCPLVTNADQSDTDGNGVGDVCEVASNDEEGPEIVFTDPTPEDGEYIEYRDPEFHISANEAIANAEITFEVHNGGFESGDLRGYEYEGYYWEIDNSESKDGAYSAHSSYSTGETINNNFSQLKRTIVLEGDSGVNFWWKVSSEENEDIFSFYINGERKESISGEVDWTEVDYVLSAGTYTLMWEYTKNETNSEGKDVGWLDALTIHPYKMVSGDSSSERTFTARSLLDGSYTYTVMARDVAGNETVTSKRTFMVDTVAPSTDYTFEVTPQYRTNNEISGTVTINASTYDDGSYLKNVCLWLGDEEENLFQDEYDVCKDLREHNSYSYDYAPSFEFYNWNTTEVADGVYPLYVLYTDNAGNVSKKSVTVKINNASLGSAADPAKISTCEEFQAIKNNTNWHYEVVNDIDCSESKTWTNGVGFEAVALENGFVNGNNFHITDIYMNTHYTGIFNTLDGGSKVSNLNFRNVELICQKTYCGGFTRDNWGTIEKSSITGSLVCSGKCGGFASQQSGTITQCWGDMTIGSGGYQGGIAGQNYAGFIDNSYFRGTITANNGGGLVGLNEGGWSGGGTVINSYSTAVIPEKQSNGGLVGWMYQYSSQTGSYWNKEVSGVDVMCGTNGTNCVNENGLVDAEMKLQDSFVGWDFENVWAIDATKNEGYPYLRWQTTFFDTPITVTDGDVNTEDEVVETPTPAKRGGGGALRVVTPKKKQEDEKQIETDTDTEEPVTDGRPTGEVQGAQRHRFVMDLRFGSTSEDVRELQERLREFGFFTYPESTGYFGELTREAVKVFQSKNGLPVTGFVGPLTREKLNAGTRAIDEGELSLEQFVELLITLGVISEEKEATAREILADKS